MQAGAGETRQWRSHIGWPRHFNETQSPQYLLNKAFSFASANGRIEAARWFLGRGVDINSRTYLNATSLHFAAHTAKAELVEFLIKQGADPDRLDDEWNGTPSGWANHDGYKELATYLTKHDLRNQEAR